MALDVIHNWKKRKKRQKQRKMSKEFGFHGYVPSLRAVDKETFDSRLERRVSPVVDLLIVSEPVLTQKICLQHEKRSIKHETRHESVPTELKTTELLISTELTPHDHVTHTDGKPPDEGKGSHSFADDVEQISPGRYFSILSSSSGCGDDLQLEEEEEEEEEAARSRLLSASEVFLDNEDFPLSPLSLGGEWATPYKSLSRCSAGESLCSVGSLQPDMSSVSPQTVEPPHVYTGDNQREQSASDQRLDDVSGESNNARHDLAVDVASDSRARPVSDEALNSVVDTSSCRSALTSEDLSIVPSVAAVSSVCHAEISETWKPSASTEASGSSSERQCYDRLDGGGLSDGLSTQQQALSGWQCTERESGSFSAREDAATTVDQVGQRNHMPTDIKHLDDIDSRSTTTSDIDDRHKDKTTNNVAKKNILTESNSATEDLATTSVGFQADSSLPDWRLSFYVTEVIEKQSISLLSVQTEVDFSDETVQVCLEPNQEMYANQQRLKSGSPAAGGTRSSGTLEQSVDLQAIGSENWTNERPELICPSENMSEIYLEPGAEFASVDVIVQKNEPAPVLFCEATEQRVKFDPTEVQKRAANEVEKHISSPKLEVGPDRGTEKPYDRASDELKSARNRHLITMMQPLQTGVNADADKLRQTAGPVEANDLDRQRLDIHGSRTSLDNAVSTTTDTRTLEQKVDVNTHTRDKDLDNEHPGSNLPINAAAETFRVDCRNTAPGKTSSNGRELPDEEVSRKTGHCQSKPVDERDLNSTKNAQETVSQSRYQSTVEAADKRTSQCVDKVYRLDDQPCLSETDSQKNSDREEKQKRRLAKLQRLNDAVVAENESVSKLAAKIWQLAVGKDSTQSNMQHTTSARGELS